MVDPGTGTALAVARAVRLIATGAVTGLLVLVLVVWRPLRRAGTVDEPADRAFVRIAGRALRRLADTLLGQAEHDISAQTGHRAHVHT